MSARVVATTAAASTSRRVTAPRAANASVTAYPIRAMASRSIMRPTGWPGPATVTPPMAATVTATATRPPTPRIGRHDGVQEPRLCRQFGGCRCPSRQSVLLAVSVEQGEAVGHDGDGDPRGALRFVGPSHDGGELVRHDGAAAQSVDQSSPTLAVVSLEHG